MTTQPQLFHMALDSNNIVYTPDWVARDMVEYFQPSGRILEPCCGDGAFLKHLPAHAEWCEIERGRDFFSWHEQVDWIVANPPYKNISDWFEHCFDVAENVLFLVPLQYLWVSTKRIKMFLKYGGIVETRAYPESAFKSWSINFATGAVHFQRGYTGATMITMYKSATA